MLWKLSCALEVDVSYFFAGLTQESFGAQKRRPILIAGGLSPSV